MYRTRAEISGPRWGVTTWHRWYVRIARIFFNIREKYMWQRQYNSFHRALDAWHRRDTLFDRSSTPEYLALWPDARPPKPESHWFIKVPYPVKTMPVTHFVCNKLGIHDWKDTGKAIENRSYHGGAPTYTPLDYVEYVFPQNCTRCGKGRNYIV